MCRPERLDWRRRPWAKLRKTWVSGYKNAHSCIPLTHAHGYVCSSSNSRPHLEVDQNVHVRFKRRQRDDQWDWKRFILAIDDWISFKAAYSLWLRGSTGCSKVDWDVRSCSLRGCFKAGCSLRGSIGCSKGILRRWIRCSQSGRIFRI